MEPAFDHAAAARHVADLVAAVTDDQLAGRTPCPDYDVADMIDHIGGLAIAFAAAARKEADRAAQGPQPDGSRLEPGWRERISGDLSALAEAWRDPAAWAGMTQVGGVTLPGGVTAVVALDELVVHGWDLAVATGRPPVVEPADLARVHDFVAQSAGPDSVDQRGIFGPVVPVRVEAPLLEKVIGMAGRQPNWTP